MIGKWVRSATDFFKDVKTELGKVTFPGKDETFGAATVVMVFTVIVSIFLFLVDTVLVRLLRLVV